LKKKRKIIKTKNFEKKIIKFENFEKKIIIKLNISKKKGKKNLKSEVVMYERGRLHFFLKTKTVVSHDDFAF